jgi:hypothetical protein
VPNSLQRPAKAAPLLSGAALLGAGLLVRLWKPRLLDVPEPDGRERNDRGLPRLARRSRDGLARVLPHNMTGTVARSLIIMGAGLILVRALDELVEDEDALF